MRRSVTRLIPAFLLISAWLGLASLLYFHHGYRWIWESHLEPNMAFVYQHSDWSDEARVRYKLGKAFDPVWKMQQSVSPTKSIALDSTLYAAPYPMNLKAFWLYHLWPRAVAWETGEVKVRLMHDSLQFFPNTP